MNENKSQPQTNKGNYSQYSPSAGGKQQGNQSGPLPPAPSGGVDMSAYRPSPAQPKTQQYTYDSKNFVDRGWAGPGPRPDRSQAQPPQQPEPMFHHMAVPYNYMEINEARRKGLPLPKEILGKGAYDEYLAQKRLDSPRPPASGGHPPLEKDPNIKFYPQVLVPIINPVTG